MSEGFASLLPGQRTKAALWSIAVGADGEIGEANVERAWVTSRHQYSYDATAEATARGGKAPGSGHEGRWATRGARTCASAGE